MTASGLNRYRIRIRFNFFIEGVELEGEGKRGGWRRRSVRGVKGGGKGGGYRR